MTNTDVMQDIREHQPAVFRALIAQKEPVNPEIVTIDNYKKGLLNADLDINPIIASCRSLSASEAAMAAHVLNICGFRHVAETISDDAYWSMTYFDATHTDILCKLLTSRHN